MNGRILAFCIVSVLRKAKWSRSVVSGLFVIPWTVAYQAPLSMGFSRQEYFEWLAISFSRRSSQPRDWTRVSHIVGRHFTVWASREVSIGVGSLSLLQGIFPTQGSNPGLPHHRLILHQLSHHGSPRILEWVAYPFSRGCSRTRNRTGVSCVAGGFFTSWAMKEALCFNLLAIH